MLAVVHDGVADPLLFSMLPKRGTSNTQERIDLVQRYASLFGADTIDCLLADREFVHRKLKPIRILKHGRKTKSIFHYGLDILTEFLVCGRNEHQLQFSDFLIINEKQLNVTG